MNIVPLPATVAAAIAGSDRAAAIQVAGATSTESSYSATASTESVDSVDKGNASEDSGADGRQLLDTFERRNRESADDDPADADSSGNGERLPDDYSRNAPVRPRIDFHA